MVNGEQLSTFAHALSRFGCDKGRRIGFFVANFSTIILKVYTIGIFVSDLFFN
jgi:hypothetical protein